MKVAFVNQPMDMLLPPYQNSIGLWTYHVAPHIAQQHSVTVYGKWSRAQRSGQGQPVPYRFMLPVVPNRKLGQWLSSRERDNSLPSFASTLYYLDYIVQIAWRLRRQRVDIAHIHNFTQFVPVVHAISPRTKIVLHMNCEWLSQLDYETMDQRIRQTALVLGSSNYITNKVRERFPHHATRCHTMYNGVDPHLFANGRQEQTTPARNGEKRLLFVGRVSPEKGVHVLVEAFCLVAAQCPEVRLDIVGPIESLPQEFIVDLSSEGEVANLTALYYQDYETYLQDLIPTGLRDRVRFWGGLPQKQLVKHYHATDLLINPSFSESFGMALVEAMASERPVVASRVGGMTEIVDGAEVGLLVERGNAPSLAEAILQLLQNDKRRLAMGKNGRQHVLKHYSWSQVARSLLQRYEDLTINNG